MNAVLITLVEWMGAAGVTLLLSLSPALRRRRPVKFVYPRREGLVSLALLALVTAFMVVYFTQIHPPTQPSATPLSPDTPLSLATYSAKAPLVYGYSELGRQVTLSLAVLLPFLAALAVRRQPLLSAGLSRPGIRPGFELGAALGLIAIFLTSKTYTILNGLSAAQGYYLAAMLFTGLAEEFVFRGYIQLRLMGWLGDVWGWVAASALFAVWQIPQKLLYEHASPTALGTDLLFLFAFGLLLGWIMRRSGSILAPGLYHAIHNWLLVL